MLLLVTISRAESPQTAKIKNVRRLFYFLRLPFLADVFARKNEEPDDLADEIEQIHRAVEYCERRNQHEVSPKSHSTIFFALAWRRQYFTKSMLLLVKRLAIEHFRTTAHSGDD